MDAYEALKETFDDLFQQAVEEGCYTEDEAAELVESLDIYSLLQVVRHNATTVYSYITQGRQERSFNYRGEDLFRQFRAADQQVGQIGVGIIVSDRRSVDAAHVQTHRLRHRDRGAIVPFILAAGVKIDIRLPPHTAIALAPADPIATSSAHSFSATKTASAAGRVRLTSIRSGWFAGWSGAGVPDVNVMPSPGSATAPTVATPSTASATCTAQSSPALAIFARAVEWVDDPDAALPAARDIVLLLFREERVGGPGRANLAAQHRVGLLVTGLPQRLAFKAAMRTQSIRIAPAAVASRSASCSSVSPAAISIPTNDR
mgnify:CR=1 FL=1